MSGGGRYIARGIEAEFEPGSRRRVLRNLMGIRSAREMARRESEALLAATERSIDDTSVEQRFTAEDVCRMHRLWLGEIYPWAGTYRQVNVEKDGFPFAAVAQVDRLMLELESGALRAFTPCRFDDVDEQAHALGVVHAELILVHPFREGNGRCARLLATLMALQAELPVLDFGGIRGMEKRRYIVAIQAAMGHDYVPIAGIFRAVIARTLRSQARILRG
ncbi:MAG: cell filamentation protein Fic [Betaproteobacteria bacterium]|nr:cell filamentation protein Fic [Betaproteobacteria bacterium]